MNLRMSAGGSSDAKIRVYNGQGAGLRSAIQAREVLQEHTKLKVDFINKDELLKGEWCAEAGSTKLLCFPGGADLPYCRDLNGRGNQLIRDYIEQGGSYLGFCAGAYYACAGVVFEPGSKLQVIGERELKFFPGCGRGAAYPGFDYKTEDGAVAAALRYRASHSICDSQPAAAAADTALGVCVGRSASVGAGEGAAELVDVGVGVASSASVGAGEGGAELVGVGVGTSASRHNLTGSGGGSECGSEGIGGSEASGSGKEGSEGNEASEAGGGGERGDSEGSEGSQSREGSVGSEINLWGLQPSDLQYSLPYQAKPQHNTASTPSADEAKPQSNTASNPSTDEARPQNNTASTPSTAGCHPPYEIGSSPPDPHGVDAALWHHCLDYSNGGPVFMLPKDCPPADVARVTVLAEYRAPLPDSGHGKGGEKFATPLEGKMAAVRCQVGKGVAVLSATHPELTPASLCHPLHSDDVKSHVNNVAASLDACKEERVGYLRLLLAACCSSWRV